MEYELRDMGESPICGLNRHYIFRVADGAMIPLDQSNRDFQEFLAWNSEQQVPLEIPE